MNVLELLTLPCERLTLPQRASALVYARDAGKAAAEMALTWEDLEDPGALSYQRHVVDHARDAGRLDAAAAEQWQKQLLEGEAMHDPRVRAFFFGWHERAVEIMTDITAGGRDDKEHRARWYLGGMEL